MADYTFNEIVDMILIVGKCRNNYDAASRPHAERFPDKRHPANSGIQNLTQEARSGSLVRQCRRHEYNENDARAITILAIVHLNHQVSIRQI